MSKFPINVVPSRITKTSRPKIRIANFGSGYSQRSTFGINQNLKVYQILFRNITFNQANTIESFLDDRGGVEAFSYPVPDLGTIITGTYSQSNQNINITIADYGLADNDEVYVNFKSGNAVNGFYVVTGTQSTHFVVQGVSQTTSGNVAVTKPKKYICRDWNRTVPYLNRVTINATFEEVAEA